jgi:hypothetical protein
MGGIGPPSGRLPLLPLQMYLFLFDQLGGREDAQTHSSTEDLAHVTNATEEKPHQLRKLSGRGMCVLQAVTMNSLKFNPGPPFPTLLCPAGRPPLKRPHSRFRGSLPARRAACGRLLPPWPPHAVRLWEGVRRLLAPSFPPLLVLGFFSIPFRR